MTLLNAAYLGIDRFANNRVKENWSSGSSQDDKTALNRAVYRQVLGLQFVRESERLFGPEFLSRNDYLTFIDFVPTVARSGLYRSKLLDNSNRYDFLEVNLKHLLRRAPQH